MVKKILKDLGYTPIPESLSMPVDLWKSWYEGKVDSFHEYRQYNGKRALKRTRKSLCMAKRVCEDWADLLFNEKVEVTAETRSAQKAIEKAFNENNFKVSANRLPSIGAGSEENNTDNSVFSPVYYFFGDRAKTSRTRIQAKDDALYSYMQGMK